jgi:hypothetical protein
MVREVSVGKSNRAWEEEEKCGKVEQAVGEEVELKEKEEG